MAAQANIVINDGAGTPAARTFVPEGTKALDAKTMKATWRENTGTFIGRAYIEEYFTPPTEVADGRLKYVVSYPVLTTVGTNDAGITPPPSVSHVLRGTANYVIPAASSDLERSHIRALLENLVGTSLVEDGVENVQRSW